jgi:ribosomal protein L11 methyltransferase
MSTACVTTLTSRRVATRLADAFMEGEHHLRVTGAAAFESDPPSWRFEAWFEEAPDLGEFTRTVARFLGDEAIGLDFDHRLVADDDWVRRSLEDLPPVRAGRFVVHGAHDAAKVRSNEVALPIEASMAFGTGHHPTTLGCLLALDRWVARRAAARRRGRRRREPRMIDIGCGTGVLGLAVAKSAKLEVDAGDVDPDSVRIARENARLAGQSARMRVVCAAGTRHPTLGRASTYDLIAANILAEPLAALAQEIRRVAAPGATVILSGLLAWQARKVAGAYLARGFRLVSTRRIGDWTTLVVAAPGVRRGGRGHAGAPVVRPGGAL